MVIVDIPCTVMLTALLCSPDPDSHQYTPLSDGISDMMHEDPCGFPQSVLHSERFPLNVFLTTLHPAEFP